MSCLVSIIIPTFNRAHLISGTLNSVLNQTFQNWECIVVDDGSIDSTEKIVKSFVDKDNRFQYHRRPNCHLAGGNGARNYGYKMSKGDFINWFDDDDLMLPDLIEKKMNILFLYNHVDYCISNIKSICYESGEISKSKVSNIINDDFLIGYLQKKYPIPTFSILIRKKVIVDNNLRFDEKLLQSQDLDFNFKLFSINQNYFILKEVLIIYRKIDGMSISQKFFINIKTYLPSFLNVREKIIIASKNNLQIQLIIVNEVLSVLRFCISNKNHKEAIKTIFFLIKLNSKSLKKIHLMRITFFTFLFLLIGRGDTKFKKLLMI